MDTRQAKKRGYYAKKSKNWGQAVQAVKKYPQGWVAPVNFVYGCCIMANMPHCHVNNHVRPTPERGTRRFVASLTAIEFCTQIGSKFFIHPFPHMYLKSVRHAWEGFHPKGA